MAVDEAGSDGVPREIDHRRARGDVSRRGPHRYDFVAAHDDHAVTQHPARFDIDEPSGPHRRHDRAVGWRIGRLHDVERLRAERLRGEQYRRARTDDRAHNRSHHHGALYTVPVFITNATFV